MALSAGMRLGPYIIETAIGSGGMGEVYRARDTKLGREVAVKVIPSAHSASLDRLMRFEREARLLAALNHPHIASIYGFEEIGGIGALVLELVEGPTLADRLLQGPFPVTEAIAIARQIAQALEAAHEKAIVHRDLKPANIKLTSDGSVKVLDFGLAKALDGSTALDLAESATMTAVGTRAGAMLGTAGYMSPEQARGQAVDERTDIWAFGCVLYEMLTGRPAFAVADLANAIAAVIHQEPEWEDLPPDLPPVLERFLRRCLAKDPAQRVRDIADVRLALEGAFEPVKGTASARSRSLWWFTAGALAAALATGIAVWMRQGSGASVAPPRNPVQFTFELRPDEQLAYEAGLPRPIAISRDGRYIAYGTRRPDGNRINLRRQEDAEATPIPGTEGGIGPFFSPDGDLVGFASGGLIKQIPIRGGVPQVIAPVSTFMGATWGADDWIVYGDWGSGLFKVSARGGTPQPLTTVDEHRGERAHIGPHLLPGGKAAVFVVRRTGEPTVEIVDLATGQRRPLLEGSNPHYLSSGDLVFTRGNTLYAVPFDLDRLAAIGPPVSLPGDVSRAGDASRALFAAADDGTLVYLPVDPGTSRLVWVDRNGRPRPVLDERQRFVHPRLSPDGTRLVVWVGTESGENELWIHDVRRKTRMRLSVGAGASRPIWTPDGKNITFQKDQSLYSVPADDSQPPKLLLARKPPASALFPLAWSRVGHVLVYSRPAPQTNRDVFTLRDAGTPTPFLATPRDERSAMLSPDGRWMVYAALETGREEEIYIQPYPGPGERDIVSRGGGREPVWSPDGTEIFYRSIDAGRLMAVDVKTVPGLSVGPPRTLFEGHFKGGAFWSNYDVTPDGTQFLMVEASEPPRRLHVVLHWADALRRQR